MMIACKLLIEAKTGWKTSIRKQLTAIDRSSWRPPAQINHCALRYPGWKTASRTEDMNVEWRFPGFCSGGCPDGFVADDRLARNLIYFYDNGSHLHLGFQHPDLGRFASGDFNYHGGQEGDGMLAILDCLAYLSTSIAAKPGLRRFGSAAVEGYFFGSKESLYYREQVQIPEPIWGEALGADEAGRTTA